MGPRRTTPLLQLVPQRLARLMARLEPRRWEVLAAVPVAAGPVHAAPIPLARAQQEAMAPLDPDRGFGPPHGGWHQRWCRVAIPEGGGGRHLHWDCDGEATVWHDGEPWAGLDVAHRTCPVPDGARELWLAVGTWQTGLWVPGARAIGAEGCRFTGCDLRRPDPAVDRCLGDLALWQDLIRQLLADEGIELPAGIGRCPPLERVDPLLRRILGGIEVAADAFDLGGVPALEPVLAALRRDLRAAPWQPRAAVVAHTHIDLVYRWPERVGIEKGVHSCATALRLLEQDPGLIFTHSQPLQYQAIGAASPALLERIRARIREGRWEVTGAFACEPDTHIPCGEALFRSLRLGQAITTELAGAPSPVCWLPDVFGYSQCLPALLRLAGVTGFFTTKLAWSGLNRFPFQAFRWRGGDGSEVQAFLSDNYNSNAEPAFLVARARDYPEVHLHDELICAVGYSDGGGGPNGETLARLARCADAPLVPRTAWSGPAAAFRRLEQAADRLPVHQGELYLEYHRGVCTSQQPMKAAYRRLEQALQTWEAVRVARGGGPVPGAGWERLCFAQFHDALPGTSVPEVYAELVPELQALGSQALGQAQAELGQGTVPFNPLPLPILAHQGGRTWRLPALGSGIPVEAASATTTPVADGWVLANGLVEARFARGRLVAMAEDGEPLPLLGGGFTLAEDHPANYDAWEVERQSLRLAWPVDPSELAADGDGRLVGHAALGERSALTVVYELRPGERHLRLGIEVDWQEDHRLLRYEMETGCRGASARFGTPFGSILRPQQPGNPLAEAMWEVPGSRWAAALGDDGGGMALLTASHWGFSCRDGFLGTSLLRAPSEPDPRSDRGRHHLRLAIGRHRDRFTGDRLPTAAAAEALFAPVLTGPLVPSALSWAGLGSLVPAWASPAPDGGGLELRLHEVAGGSGAVPIPAGWTARPVDALGRLGAPMELLEHGPYAILSVRLERAAP